MNLSNRTMAWALLAAIVAAPGIAQGEPGAITVFVAKKVVIMDPTQPAATAVAVRDGEILSVASLQDLQPWLKNNNVTIDEQVAAYLALTERKRFLGALVDRVLL